METAPASSAVCSITSSSVTSPSARPSVNANPELVVASALKPSASSMRAEPASHGFGMMNGSPSWRARNSAVVAGKLVLLGSDGSLVALDVGSSRAGVDLATDLLDAEDAPHHVAEPGGHGQGQADQRRRPCRHDHLELRLLERADDRRRDLL